MKIHYLQTAFFHPDFATPYFYFAVEMSPPAMRLEDPQLMRRP